MVSASGEGGPAADRGRFAGLFRRKQQAGPWRVPWLVGAPALLLLFAFHFIPVVAGSYYALTDWDGLNDANFIGLDNFREIFDDPVARDALWHTIQIAVAFFVAVNVLGLLLALGLNRALKTRNFLRALFFVPVVMAPLAVAYVWQFMFQNDGVLNQALGTFGLDSWQRPWLGDPTWAIWTVFVVMVWQYVGLTMVVYLAGLQRIPDELIEAATVDGAGTWLRFRRLVLPQLAPAITINATLTVIFGLRAFEQVIALTGGGPVNATETLATQVWRQTFQDGRFGYGAALALLLTALVVIVSVTQLLILRRREARIR